MADPHSTQLNVTTDYRAKRKGLRQTVNVIKGQPGQVRCSFVFAMRAPVKLHYYQLYSPKNLYIIEFSGNSPICANGLHYWGPRITDNVVFITATTSRKNLRYFQAVCYLNGRLNPINFTNTTAYGCL